MHGVKVRVAFTIILSMPLLLGFTWYPIEQKTIAWEAVTTLSNGDPIPAGDVIKYDVFIEDLNSSVQTNLGETDQTSYAITFPYDGEFRTGVRSIRYIDKNGDGAIDQLDGGLNIKSTITWSDIVGIPEPFGFRTTTQFAYVDSSGDCGIMSPCYASIISAVSDVVSGTTIRIAAGSYTEDVVLAAEKSITLSGGWDVNFSDQDSESTVDSVTAERGSLVTEFIVMYGP